MLRNNLQIIMVYKNTHFFFSPSLANLRWLGWLCLRWWGAGRVCRRGAGLLLGPRVKERQLWGHAFLVGFRECKMKTRAAGSSEASARLCPPVSHGPKRTV